MANQRIKFQKTPFSLAGPFPLRLTFLISVFLFFSVSLSAQEQKKSAFLGSSLIHMPSTEDVGKNGLDFRFNHRFGNAKSASYDFLGLDNGANTQLSLDYGVTDRLTIGIARTSFQKTYEARGKIRLLTQDSSFPVTISFFGVFGQETEKQEKFYGPYLKISSGLATFDPEATKKLNTYELTYPDRQSMLASFLISRRFGEVFSLQLSPMFVHRNFVKEHISNDRMGLDVSFRIHLFKRLDFTFGTILTSKRDYIGDSYVAENRKTKINGVEYSASEVNDLIARGKTIDTVINNILLSKPVEYMSVPLSFGVDFETGGHVFQLFVTNSRSIAHTQLLRGADYDYSKKEWTLGFNIHRYFSLESSNN
ncbi:DUF5777 family beta-barrel protein [Leptospira borgpetersenii]|uniref:DUF5777 domain-containing protein n=1 Tax=Leptospira borgpetersenii serovar Ballum TaxID=280505 RepID=A0A0S2IUF4_LEPBO|nr:DUF5777 family beta-barrel protein [Leptospira borgpetersenii]EMO10727.1 hypothetical protein LEP1GSC137_3951 [Leptospira borgpetersenii str. Noumea 25]ALO26963.1 hypothetical protein LBBP_02743 [Leptospira borgpetersenii serovar Ballum]ANH01228.2 Uncharacterized protein LB4E_2164 [Leptospira borgpetersenii str. 4E]EKQ99156.1 hypothetical protein LEP1GSC121_2679 [Leptospira borgpetersenii serovar Castellonis str. 200801910]OOV42557.1 hypothetical protein B1H38_14945 [Leptospira borgpetersen